MKSVVLGATGIEVSCLGLGTVKFGRNQGVRYPEPFHLPSEHDIVTLLDEAQALGITLLDTAPAYGDSEERLGKILQHQRHRWIICTKAGEEFINEKSLFDFSPHAICRSVERSLKRLHTDVLDIVLVHSNGDDKKIIEVDGVFDTLGDLKKKGHIRAFGMSTKTVEGGMLAVDHSDMVMVTYNPLHTKEKEVIRYAHQKNKGIFIKKALASGHIDQLPGEDPILATMKFIFQEPGVSSIILGTLSTAHLRHNVACVERCI